MRSEQGKKPKLLRAEVDQAVGAPQLPCGQVEGHVVPDRKQYPCSHSDAGAFLDEGNATRDLRDARVGRQGVVEPEGQGCQAHLRGGRGRQVDGSQAGPPSPLLCDEGEVF